MLLIKTHLDKSPIEGFGLFASEFVPNGALIQKLVPRIDIEISPELFLTSALSDIEKETLLRFCYKHKINGDYILPADNTRFINHAETPNITCNGFSGEVMFALRDIQAGEELTIDYREFDVDADKKIDTKTATA